MENAPERTRFVGFEETRTMDAVETEGHISLYIRAASRREVKSGGTAYALALRGQGL